MTFLLATNYGPMALLMIIVPLALIPLAILALSCLIMLARERACPRIKTACKVAGVIFALTMLLAVALAIEDGTSSWNDVFWIGTFVGLPFGQCLSCWLFAWMHEHYRERQPTWAQLIPWSGALVWLMFLVVGWRFLFD